MVNDGRHRFVPWVTEKFSADPSRPWAVGKGESGRVRPEEASSGANLALIQQIWMELDGHSGEAAEVVGGS